MKNEITYSHSINLNNHNLDFIIKELQKIKDKYPDDTIKLHHISGRVNASSLSLRRIVKLNEEESLKEHMRSLKRNINSLNNINYETKELIKIKHQSLHKYQKLMEKRRIKGKKDPFMVAKEKKKLEEIKEYHRNIKKRKDKIKELIDEAMTLTYQIPDIQTIKQHGESVFNYYLDLNNDKKLSWRLPEWFLQNEQFIKENIYPLDIMREYLINHDCGKPFCKTVDEDGVHFPNHEEESSHYYNISSNFKESHIVSQCIKKDMDIHRMKAKDIENFCKNKTLALSLLIAGLCEVHSNAQLFGGIESTSFKIKWKQIDRRGKQILKNINLDF